MWPEAYGIIGALRESRERGGVIYAKDLTANPHGTSRRIRCARMGGHVGGALLAGKGAFSILPKRVHEERESELVKKIQRNKGEHGERRRERDRETKGKKKMIA